MMKHPKEHVYTDDINLLAVLGNSNRIKLKRIAYDVRANGIDIVVRNVAPTWNAHVAIDGIENVMVSRSRFVG